MLKIAAVFMTTGALAGLLISGPASLASNSAPFATQVSTVKVKTIAIHMGHSKRSVTPVAFSAGTLDGMPLFAGPAPESETPGPRRA